MLCGKPLTLWTDAELESHFRRYNIGWIVCRSDDAAARFRTWSAVSESALVQDQPEVVLFTITNAARSYALKGAAKIVHMDSHHITLADVVPNEKGEVILSLHYQRGLKASPERVVIEPADDGKDPIPFVRLRLDRPAARVTITWQDR
jgi:hypothetical protein